MIKSPGYYYKIAEDIYNCQGFFYETPRIYALRWHWHYVEHLGNSLISQFKHLHFEKHLFPYIDSSEKAQEVLDLIHQKPPKRPHHRLSL